MDVNKQMETIQSMARGSVIHWLKGFAIATCAVLLVAGFYTGQSAYYMFMILPALLACSAHQTAPHIRAASRAIRSGTRTDGVVEIDIEDSSDSQTFYVTVAVAPSSTWQFEFIPLGWKPVAGPTQATLYSLQHMKWPALIAVQHGVMYPRQTPKQVLR